MWQPRGAQGCHRLHSTNDASFGKTHRRCAGSQHGQSPEYVGHGVVTPTIVVVVEVEVDAVAHEGVAVHEQCEQLV